MAKPRDYKAEYRRRIQSGEARGLSRSQAAGHPKRGELPASSVGFVNPFKEVKESINRFIDNIQKAFGRDENLNLFGPSGKRNQVEYFERVGERGVNTLPRWSIGSMSQPLDLGDLKQLINEARDKRFQNSYTFVVCGYLEETYPGHDPEEPVECLSYRMTVGKLRFALSKSPANATEFINLTLPPHSEEKWLQVNEVQIIDKE